MQTPTLLIPNQPATPPDHLQLPDKDGAIVENYVEHPQSNLLTDCLTPRLEELRPDGQFSIGCDSGIYWRWTQPVLEGCKAQTGSSFSAFRPCSTEPFGVLMCCGESRSSR